MKEEDRVQGRERGGKKERGRKKQRTERQKERMEGWMQGRTLGRRERRSKGWCWPKSLFAKVMRSRTPPMDREMMQLEVRPFARGGAVQGTFSGAVDQGWLALAAIWPANK